MFSVSFSAFTVIVPSPGLTQSRSLSLPPFIGFEACSENFAGIGGFKGRVSGAGARCVRGRIAPNSSAAAAFARIRPEDVAVGIACRRKVRSQAIPITTAPKRGPAKIQRNVTGKRSRNEMAEAAQASGKTTRIERNRWMSCRLAIEIASVTGISKTSGATVLLQNRGCSTGKPPGRSQSNPMATTA